MACELDFEAMMREERARRKRQSTKPRPALAVPHTKQNLCSDSDLPDSVTIIEDFVTEAEAAALTEAAQRGKWVVMPNRRVQNLGGTPHPDGGCTGVLRHNTHSCGIGMIEQPLPAYMQPLCDAMVSSGLFEHPPNHCLLNECAPAASAGAC